MKHLRGLACVSCALSIFTAQAALYQGFNWSPNAAVPDGSTTGWTDTRSVSFGSGYTITDLNVGLNVSGGWNGDLYAYLSYTPDTGGGSGFVVLLNRIGRDTGSAFGFSGNGMNVILSDPGTVGNGVPSYTSQGDIHQTGSGTPSGYFEPDGRNSDPASVVYASARNSSLSSFNGLDANGTWTLFFADMSGGHVSTVSEWSLGITAVPEPVNVALGAFGIGVIGLGLIRKWRSKLTA